MKSYFLTELKYQLRRVISRWSKPFTHCSIALLIAFGSIYFWGSDVGQRLDLWVLRQFFQLRGPLSPPEDVVIVAIDDESYQKLGASDKQPFPRILTAKALAQIVSANPKVVILDANIQKEQTDLEADRIMEEALRAGPTTIWSGLTPLEQGNKKSSDAGKYIINASENRFRNAAKMELPMLIASKFDTIFLIGYDLKKPNKLSDFIPISRALVELGKYQLELPQKEGLINFYGPAGTINRIPIFKFLGTEAQQAKEQLKDKVVFVGFQSLGRAKDQTDKDEYYISASDAAMFGVEIHANIAANLIDKSWIKRRDILSEVLILFFFALFFATIGIAITPEKAVPLTFTVISLAVGYSYWCFRAQNFWHGGIGTLLLVGAVTILGGAIYHFVIIKRFKRYIQKTFKFDVEAGV